MRRVSQLVAKAKHVVEHFTRSSKATYQLREVQRAAKSDDIKELVQDVATRWMATYDMMQRLLEMMDYVHAVLSARYMLNTILKFTSVIRTNCIE